MLPNNSSQPPAVIHPFPQISRFRCNLRLNVLQPQDHSLARRLLHQAWGYWTILWRYYRVSSDWWCIISRCVCIELVGPFFLSLLHQDGAGKYSNAMKVTFLWAEDAQVHLLGILWVRLLPCVTLITDLTVLMLHRGAPIWTRTRWMQISTWVSGQKLDTNVW